MRCALVFLLAAGCASGFDAKAAADGNRIRAEDRPTPPPKSAIAQEAFALAPIAYDVDAFAKTPDVSMPIDAHMTIGTFTAVQNVGAGQDINYAGHTCDITYAGGWDRFEADIAPRLLAAVTPPPGTALLFALEKGHYAAVLVRTPPILSSSDAAAADVVQVPRYDIDLNSDKTTKREIPSVAVTLTKQGQDKLAAWTQANPGRPVAQIGNGRVVHKTTVAAKTFDAPWPPRTESVVLQLDGQTTADAEALARAIKR